MFNKPCFISIVFVLLLNACASEPVASGSSNQCIASFETFEYTIPEDDAPEQEFILPLDPWRVESILPEVPDNYPFEVGATRSVEDYVEVWLQPDNPSDIYRDSDPDSYVFLVYRSDTKTWRTIPAKIEGSQIFVDTLYVASDGTIWGRNVWVYDARLSSQPVLSRFDETIGRFEPEQTTKTIPHGYKNWDSHEVNYPYWDLILLDSKGIFWFFSYSDAIYSYDPQSQNIEYRASLSEFSNVWQAEISPDGSIYFTLSTEAEILRSGYIMQFIPATGEIVAVNVPREPWLLGDILVDHSGILWLDAYGWRDLNGNWHKLHPRMFQFVWKIAYEDYWEYYYPPHVVMESSDGRLWFESVGGDRKNLKSGVAWFDPQTGNGCWFTSVETKVIEDSQNNLWLVADGKLYVSPVIP